MNEMSHVIESLPDTQMTLFSFFFGSDGSKLTNNKENAIEQEKKSVRSIDFRAMKHESKKNENTEMI